MTSTNNEREARRLAAELVGENLAACVQIIPKIRSIYEWNGKICDDQEYLLLIKTMGKRIAAVKKYLLAEHSYEVPECLVFSSSDSLDDYHEWMKDVTR